MPHDATLQWKRIPIVGVRRPETTEMESGPALRVNLKETWGIRGSPRRSQAHPTKRHTRTRDWSLTKRPSKSGASRRPGNPQKEKFAQHSG